MLSRKDYLIDHTEVIMYCDTLNISNIIGSFSSMMESYDFPKSLTIIFNGYNNSLDSLFDISEFRQANIIKISTAISKDSILKFTYSINGLSKLLFTDRSILLESNLFDEISSFYANKEVYNIDLGGNAFFIPHPTSLSYEYKKLNLFRFK